jgi:hypothetical protein
MDLIALLLSINGVQNVPSLDQRKSDQKEFLSIGGIPTVRYQGALGHVYYANSIAQIVVQVCVSLISVSRSKLTIRHTGNGQS